MGNGNYEVQQEILARNRRVFILLQNKQRISGREGLKRPEQQPFRKVPVGAQ